MRTTILFFSLLFLATISARATPPHYVDVREVLLAANDSVFAVQEFVFDNLGSHYNHIETLSIVLYRADDRSEMERTIIRSVEYGYDFETEERVVIKVIEESDLELAELLDEHGMTLAFDARWPEGWEIVDSRLHVVRHDSTHHPVLTADETMRPFPGADTAALVVSPALPEPEFFLIDDVTFDVVGSWFVSSVDYHFVAIRRQLDGDAEQTVRVVAVPRARFEG